MNKQFVIAGALLLAVATPVAAQRGGAVPEAGMNAVGIFVGVAVPGEELFKSGLNVGVSGEHYLTRRASVRGQLSGAFWRFTDFVEDRARPITLTGNIVYNWEHGAVHPYVTAGLGYYRFRFTEADFDTSDSKFGLNIGGGAEYFISPRDSITGELLVHPVGGDASGRFGDYGTFFWTLSGGYKKYF